MNRKGIAVFMIVTYLLATTVAAKRVLFYEVGVGSGYTIEGDYSKFAEELRKKNYEVASIEKGELTKEKLENYDILVIQNLNKQLTTGEISAIIWFVLQKGRGLFINGGGSGSANQMTIPFGVTVDSGLLIDNLNQIPALKDRNSFVVSNFPATQGVGFTVTNGVSKIGFYKDSGLVLSGSTKCIAQAGPGTYSDTGSFASGTSPCLVAASTFGKGLVLTTSDLDFLGNKNIDEYNNKNFGMNIMSWLSITTNDSENGENDLPTGEDPSIMIKELRLETMNLKQQQKQVGDEKAEITSRYNSVNMQLTECQQENVDIKSKQFMGLSMNNWAIIALGICILLAAIFYSKKKTGEVKIKDEDILNELGYELEGQGGAPGEAPKK